jgi:hypothetical protein
VGEITAAVQMKPIFRSFSGTVKRQPAAVALPPPTIDGVPDSALAEPRVPLRARRAKRARARLFRVT